MGLEKLLKISATIVSSTSDVMTSFDFNAWHRATRDSLSPRRAALVFIQSNKLGDYKSLSACLDGKAE